MRKNDVIRLIGLDEKDYELIEVTNEMVGKRKIKIVKVKCIKKKHRCPKCNNFTSSIHDTMKPARIKYLDVGGEECVIYVTKRRFICHKCHKKFTEPTTINQNKSSNSNKVKQMIRKDLLEYNLSIKYIAKKNNVSDYTVRAELLDAMSDYPEHVKTLPRVISFDEFKADTNRGKYAFVMNDPIHKKTLDILPSRRKEDLISYFTKVENRQSVEYVISDMYEPYLLVTKIMFPKAKYVVDRFHFVEYIMEGLDDVRIRLQKEFGEKPREYKILKNKNNVSLLRKQYNDIEWYTYTKRYKNGHMVEMLRADILDKILEISDDLKRAYQLKEMFLDIVSHSTYEEAEKEFLTWIDLVKESKIEEMIKVAKTIENWLEYIVNSFIDKRFSNGYTEGLNNKIKVIKRIGFGYKNFNFFRMRLLYILNGKVVGSKNKKSKKS